MKNTLLYSMKIGGIVATINFILVFVLTTFLETPYLAPGSTELQPVLNFAVTSGVLSFILIFIGAFLLTLISKKNAVRGVKIWRGVGITFLVLYGAMPFFAPGVASIKAAIMVNILHAIAGFMALYFLPKKLEL